jgi:preprotein translocase subunit SecD
VTWARVELTDAAVDDARAMPGDEAKGIDPYIGLSFDQKGGDAFYDLTKANVMRRIGIVLDDAMQSAPLIRSAIGGGHVSLTLGKIDPAKLNGEAKSLATILRMHRLPGKLVLRSKQLLK